MYGLGFANNPADVDPNAGAYQSMLDEMAAAGIGSGDVGQPGPAPTSGTSFSAWLQANSSAVYIGTGILVLMAMFGGRRR